MALDRVSDWLKVVVKRGVSPPSCTTAALAALHFCLPSFLCRSALNLHCLIELLKDMQSVAGCVCGLDTVRRISSCVKQLKILPICAVSILL